MIPIKQTQLHNPPAFLGNCFRACLASVMEMDIEDIPPFEEAMFSSDPDENWYDQFLEWLHEQGYGIMETWSSHPTLCDILVRPSTSAYVLARGPSPRNENESHYVVYRNGEMGYDPHPSGDGLAGAPCSFKYIFPI